MCMGEWQENYKGQIGQIWEWPGNFPVIDWRQTHPWRIGSLSLQVARQCPNHKRVSHLWLSEPNYWRCNTSVLRRVWQFHSWLSRQVTEEVHSKLLAVSVPFHFLEGPHFWLHWFPNLRAEEWGRFWEVLHISFTTAPLYNIFALRKRVSRMFALINLKDGFIYLFIH